MDNLENNKRIVKNTMALYVRMLFTMIVSLYTTRIVLQTLGEEDYGLFNLVGAVISMMGIFTSLLTQGTSRFITVALGKNNSTNLKNTFSSSVTIHVAFASIILILGILIGLPTVEHLNIESSRIEAAKFVFVSSLATAMIGIIQSPYNATIIAHEKMNIYAYIGVWDAISKLIIVYLLTAMDFDKLKLYSVLYFLTSLITFIMYYTYSKKNFNECQKIRFRFDKQLYKDIFCYTGWNTIGAIAFTMNGQGITIILNMFSTVVVAARGVALTVSNFIFNFVNNFLTATRPQIIKLYSSHNISKMNRLIMRTSKFSLILISIIGIPLFIEIDKILLLWLGEVPEYTSIFIRFSLVQGLIQAIDHPIGTGIHAVGKMKLPNITSSLIYMIILPLCYFVIKLGAYPTIVYVITICVFPIVLFTDMYILNKYTSFPIKEFLFKNILTTTILVITTTVATGYIVNLYFEQSLMRILITTIISYTIYLPSVFLFALNKGERQIAIDTIRNRFIKKH